LPRIVKAPNATVKNFINNPVSPIEIEDVATRQRTRHLEPILIRDDSKTINTRNNFSNSALARTTYNKSRKGSIETLSHLKETNDTKLESDCKYLLD